VSVSENESIGLSRNLLLSILVFLSSNRHPVSVLLPEAKRKYNSKVFLLKSKNKATKMTENKNQIQREFEKKKAFAEKISDFKGLKNITYFYPLYKITNQ